MLLGNPVVETEFQAAPAIHIAAPDASRNEMPLARGSLVALALLLCWFTRASVVLVHSWPFVRRGSQAVILVCLVTAWIDFMHSIMDLQGGGALDQETHT